MRAGPALLLLGLGLGLGLGPGLLPPSPAPGGAPASPPDNLIRGLGVRGDGAPLRRWLRAAPADSVRLTASRGPHVPGRRARAGPLRGGGLRARAPLGAPRPGALVGPPRGAPRGRLLPAWAFRLQLRGFGAAGPARSASQAEGRDPRSAPQPPGCPPDGPAPSASCQLRPCIINYVKINTDNPGSPVYLNVRAEITINATFRIDCAIATSLQQTWGVFPVKAVGDLPDWNNPLDLPHLEMRGGPEILYVPRDTLVLGVYMFNFTLSVSTIDPKNSQVTDSDAIYLCVVRSPLKAVILGDANITLGFKDSLTLDGGQSCDPDADIPREDLHFFWYCTTSPNNYDDQGQVTVMGSEVCHPEQATLKWPWASGPVLKLLPETLKGDQVYFFRMVIQKADRTAFADRRVHVLPGPLPKAHLSCIENCDRSLIVSDRFSLFLNCTGCTGHDSYNWSIVSASGAEVAFDWLGKTVTGRNTAYLSVKAFAFSHFLENEFGASLHVASWSGFILTFKYSFIINNGPEIGQCKINPAQGIALFTKFVVQCDGFVDKHLPLTYKIIVSDLYGIGEISSVVENTLGTILYFGTKSTTPPSFLPVGELANHYAMKVHAQVYDSLGAFSQVTLRTAVQPPTVSNSSKTVLAQLLGLTKGPTSLLSTLLQKQHFLPAGYLMYMVASILNTMKTDSTLQDDKSHLQEHLVNQSFVLPLSTLEGMSQVVTTITKLTQSASGFTGVARKHATARIWQANQALQEYRRQDQRFRSEQIEIVSTGILTSLSNFLKLATRHELVKDPFHIAESLSDTVLASKVPGNETTILSTPNLKMYVQKVEKQDVAQVFRDEKHCPNCFHPALNASSAPALPANAHVSTMFCEFAGDPFPWLNFQENISTQVVGFRMTGARDKDNTVEVTPDVAEMYLIRKNLTFEAFNLTVGWDTEGDESLKKTRGAFSFDVDTSTGREVLVHIVTKVTLLFQVSVYAGSQVAPSALVASFLVPNNIPPVANQSGLFNLACPVKQARVVCLPAALLQGIAQRSHSARCTISMLLQAPRFVLKPNSKLVRIHLFSVQCLDMRGIQSEWRGDSCALGEKTSSHTVHCVCKNVVRARRQLGPVRFSNLHLHTRYVAAKMIVIPNPVDLQIKLIQKLNQNPVSVFFVLLIMLIYIVLAFWALHRDEIDNFLRDRVIVLPDNDPYDNICYLVTVFTGSRWGSGTRANVFMQLKGTASTSDVHCLSHPHFISLYRGSINTFLLTTKSDLGDLHSIRVWHNNEGHAPSWYLSRIKVENLFSRHIWLFICRKWLSIDTTLDRTFHVIHPDEPLARKDFFLIDVSNKLKKGHMWFSVFADVVGKSFNRLQRLSCCLAVLLSSLLCNIMFFNLSKEQTEGYEMRYIRSMMIGIESVLITVPVQLLITFLFTYSQKKPRVALNEVAPQTHPLLSEKRIHWGERLEKWHAYEARARKAAKRASTRKPGLPKASNRSTFKPAHQRTKVETKAPETRGRNTNFSNKNVQDHHDVYSEGGFPQEHLNPIPVEKKPSIILPWWCVYIAWFLVFATCSISSFFIVFYGLTYGYEKSVEWAFASFCSFCQSIFLVQPCKITLRSGFRTSRPKYCKNLSWTTGYHYTEIKLEEIRMNPEEMQKLHERIVYIRGTRMYQPLTEDEIQIFKRRKKIKRRAILFLSYLVTHFIFLALLLILIVLLRHSDSFYYNQFIHDQFSEDLATVTKLKDIYKWLNSVLLPLFHNDLNPTFLFDGSSMILGLPLMRQVRAKPSEKRCLPAESFVPSSVSRETHCHPEYGIDPEDTKSYSHSWNEIGKRDVDKNASGFTYKPQEERWVYYSYGLLHTYGSGGYAFYFFPEQQQFNSTLRLKELQGSNWLDEKTWAVILELTTFNPDVNLICSISVIFEASQLGVVNTSISVYSFTLADFNRQTSAEIYLYVAILIFFLAYIVDEVYIITQERASYVRSVYNLLNFALKCIFTVLIMLFFRKHFLATGIFHFYLSNPDDFVPFHAVSQIDHIMRIILGFLLFLTILKTLRYSRVFYDVRLAQRAIQTALPGICHMALVVSVYFFVYVAFGYLVFGQHEWNYSNFLHATQTILSYCVSAFQDTEFSSNRFLGVLFLSSFMLVMICILINLFQAVILSSYDEMKQPVYEEPSEEAEAMAYLYRKLRDVFSFLTSQPQAKEEPVFITNMLYGQPAKKSHRYLGLKTRNINGKKMVYLVV